MGAMISANQIKPGSKFVYQGKLCKALSTDWVKPGKGGAYAQVKVRFIIEKNQADIRLRSDEKLEKASINAIEMEYLYQEGGAYCFMNLKNYEQVFIDTELVSDSAKYLIPNCKVTVEYFKDLPIGVALSRTVELTIKMTDPPLKGATIASSPKPATLETGAVIMVPQFIENGEKIIVDTEQDSYIERAKN
ncbi:MAG: elongation factor P [Nitrospinota bacterium]